jgi:RNA polymerase sigma factor (TIGR02999 family)
MVRPVSRGEDITASLRAWRAGDERAGEAVLERVYGELKRIAAAQFRAERAGHTLQPTAVVHEAFLRLLQQQRVEWRDRAHFFGVAAAMMRRVLVDHARARATRKRSPESGASGVTLTAANAPAAEILDLDRLLASFAVTYPRQARVVEMRYFADLEVEEIAACLDVSPATVKRDWQFARAWLRAALGES